MALPIISYHYQNCRKIEKQNKFPATNDISIIVDVWEVKSVTSLI